MTAPPETIAHVWLPPAAVAMAEMPERGWRAGVRVRANNSADDDDARHARATQTWASAVHGPFEVLPEAQLGQLGPASFYKRSTISTVLLANGYGGLGRAQAGVLKRFKSITRLMSYSTGQHTIK